MVPKVGWAGLGPEVAGAREGRVLHSELGSEGKQTGGAGSEVAGKGVPWKSVKLSSV